MPTGALKLCRKPGCSRTTPTKYCDHHKDTDSKNERRFDKERAADPVRRQYFTKAWAVTSRYIRSRDLRCMLGTICHGGAPAEVADHIIPARRWVDMHDGDIQSFYDEENLQGACIECHNAKTAGGN